MNLASSPKTVRQRITAEVGLFTGLLFLGFVIMPIVIWFIGQNIFGAYGGEGYGDFFGSLSAKIRARDTAAWFLVLSPWLAIMVLRLMALAWRATRKM